MIWAEWTLDGPWPPLVVVRRVGSRRAEGGEDVQPDRHRQDERRRSPGVARRRAGAHRRASGTEAGRTPPLGMATTRATASRLTAAAVLGECLPSTTSRRRWIALVSSASRSRSRSAGSRSSTSENRSVSTGGVSWIHPPNPTNPHRTKNYFNTY